MKKSVLFFGLAFVLFSCNSGNKETSTSVTDDELENVDRTSIGETYSCLEEFQENYQNLLTTDDVEDVYPLDFGGAKVNLSSGSFGVHEYSWPSDRPEIELEVSGMKMMLPDNNLLGVSNLSFIRGSRNLKSDKDFFDMGYKQLSQKELKKIEDNLSKQSEDVQKAGKEMMKLRAKHKWEFVDGTGTSAWYKWDDKFGGELAVLAGKAKFTIKSKVSNDPQQNKNIALKLAEHVMEKCH